MVLEAPHARAALAAAVFVVAAVGQFAISAIYHCNSWPPGKHAVLMRCAAPDAFCPLVCSRQCDPGLRPPPTHTLGFL
jgi:hypothetical protein